MLQQQISPYEKPTDLQDSFEIVCFYQMFRPLKHYPKEGHGNCCECVADENNRFCWGFSPHKKIPWHTFRVVD